MERETGIEPATSSLGSWRSTAELLPLSEITLGFRLRGQGRARQEANQSLAPDADGNNLLMRSAGDAALLLRACARHSRAALRPGLCRSGVRSRNLLLRGMQHTERAAPV